MLIKKPFENLLVGLFPSGEDDDVLSICSEIDVSQNTQKKKKKKVDDSPTASSKSSNSSSSIGSDGKKRQKKVVSFHPEVKMVETLHRKDYTQEEKKRTWFTRDEYFLIKVSVIVTIDDIQKKYNERTALKLPSIRGLEHRLYDRAMERKGHRLQGVIAVLEEQEKQMRLGKKFVRNSDIIALRYATVSQYCALQAYELGKQDYEEICDYYPDIIIKNTSSDDEKKLILNDDNSCWGSSSSSVQTETQQQQQQQQQSTSTIISVVLHKYLCS